MKKSLWLHPSKSPVKVNLYERFRAYPYFIESFDQYVGLKIPKLVPVTWGPFEPLLKQFDSWNEGEAEAHEDWIREVSKMMRDGVDVPPVLVSRGKLFDGLHRSWAAHDIGLKSAPMVDIFAYWKR